MPPTNTSFLTATELGSLPASTSQNVHDSGTTYEVFHKFTAPAGAVVVGVFARGDLSVYRPTVRVYVGPAASPIQILGIAALNKALQFPVTPGLEYFIKSTPNAGNPTPAALQVDVEVAPNDAPQRGDALINDDSDGFAAVMISPTTGDIRRFVAPFPAGEAGDSLPDGTDGH
jgi:hypothetical protein